MQHITIPARFNGPPTSGNGGYSAGVLAAFVEGGARVRLHRPPPLDTPLEVRAADSGVDLFDGDSLVASARQEVLELDVPDSPGLAAARLARERFPGFERHLYPTCFVCGPGRPAKDGLELFAGPVGARGLYACPWQPSLDLLNAAGQVKPEFIWSALDCPSGFGAFGDHQRPMLLGELTLAQFAPVPGEQELVVYAWPLGSERRKFYGGAAVATTGGEVLAAARATWIAVD